MSPRFVLGREKVPCVAEVVNRSLKADCTDFTVKFLVGSSEIACISPQYCKFVTMSDL